MKILTVSIVLILIVSSCNSNSKNDHFVLSPKDKSQSITIMTAGDIRYIVDGNHDSLPDTNYIKINISKIDPIGDEIGVCWNKGKYRWEVVNHQSDILENKLDTAKYKFNTSWELDNRGIPNAAKYRRDNCGSTGTDYFSPANGDDLMFEKIDSF